MRKGKTLVKYLWMTVGIYLSLIMPAYCFSSAKVFYRQSVALASGEEGGSVSYDGWFLNREEIQKVEEALGTQELRITSSMEEWLPEGGVVYQVNGVHGKWEKRQSQITEGRDFTWAELKEGERICLISRELQKELGKEIGDQVEVRGVGFQVIGITSNVFQSAMMEIPYLMMEKVYPNYRLQNNIRYGRTGNQESSFLIERLLLGLPEVDQVLWIRTGIENKGEDIRFLTMMIGARGMAGGFLMLCCVLNLFLLAKGNLQEKRVDYAVKRAIGIPVGKLCRELFRENVLPVILAAGCLMGSFSFVMRCLGLQKEVRFDLMVIGSIAAVALGISLVLSWLLARYLMKERIVELLQGERR